MYLAHIGTPHEGSQPHSGRYKYGSGENPMQGIPKSQGEWLSDTAKRIRKENPNITAAELARALGFKSQNQMRIAISASDAQRNMYRERAAIKLKNKGYSKSAIARELGVSITVVTKLLEPNETSRHKVILNTADVIRDSIAKQGAVDTGPFVNMHMGVSESDFRSALKILEDEGYKRWYFHVEQLGTRGNETTVTVLADPKQVSWKEINSDPQKIGTIVEYSTDCGKTYYSPQKPVDVSSKRVSVCYAEDGGKDKDGVIELRRGVDDLSLGGSNYAQVRISVDGTHYLKGMAVYSDDLPPGVDIRYNTSKTKDVPMMSDDKDNTVLKPMKKSIVDGEEVISPTNPFGATIYQKQYVDKDGKPHQSAINFVNEEGAWGDGWSSSLSSQFLSKQTRSLAKDQLKKAYDQRKAEFDDIMSMTNPVVKEYLLEKFADECDGAAVHLKAAAMPRQAWHAILPLSSTKENEIFAPNYNDGETVVLIRYPHAGRFEIPELTVNNKNEEGRRVIGQNARDAVGIHPRVAEQLSGADFDGDTVLVIPNNDGKIKVHEALKGLENFDHKVQFRAYDGMTRVGEGDGFNKQRQMGMISNLITDMTILGADYSKIERAVKHSMVIIDAEKHNLDWRASEKEFRIQELRDEFQNGGGASTLISRAKNEKRVDDRRAGVWITDPITGKKKKQLVNPETGDKEYEPTEKKKKKKTKVDGVDTWVETDKPVQTTSTQMAEAKDAFELSSGSPMETVYANHANSLKDLARKSRLEALSVEYHPVTTKALKARYSDELESLEKKLNVALMNAPLERRAQAIGNSLFRQERDANPGMSASDAKKAKARALAAARAQVGAGKKKIGSPDLPITDREWEAIQSGAVSKDFLRKILSNSDIDVIKSLSRPKPQSTISSSDKNRVRSLRSNGATNAEIAQALGISVSSVQAILSE